MNDENYEGFAELTEGIETIFDDQTMQLSTALEAAVAKCVARAARYNGKSKLKLGLTFAVESNRVVIKASLDTELPTPGALPIFRFVDSAGRLVSEDPRQTKLPLNIVDMKGEAQQ